MIFLKWLSYLPLSVLYLFSDLLFLVAVYVLRYRREVTMSNLRACFPEKDEAEIHRIMIDFYKNFADTIIETLKMVTMGESEIKRRINIKNPEIVLAYLEKGQPVILMLAHYANWEWTAQSCNRILGYPMDFVYKTLSNKHFDKLVYDTRSRFGNFPLTMEDTIKHTMRRRNIPRMLTLVADQLPGREDQKYWANILGRPTAFFIGADRIAQMIGYPAFALTMHRTKRGYYEISFEQVGFPPYQKGQTPIVAAYTKILDQTLRKEPSSWLWSHKRWKYTKEEVGD